MTVGMGLLSSIEYNKDGKTKVSQKNYYYDAFHLVNKISSNDYISGSTLTEKLLNMIFSTGQ